MKKVLVTGATGFLGRHLLRHLKEHPYLSLITTSIEPLEKVATYDWIADTHYIPANLYFDRPDWYDFLGKPDILIHLAWQGLPNYKEDFHFTTNLYKDYHFIKQLVQAGLQDITIAGTCFEYGMQEGSLKEDMCTKPDNPYAIAKDTLRKMLEMSAKQQPFHFKWTRLFYMYGDGQNPNAILSQLKKAVDNKDTVFNMSGGEQLRDYQPVESMAHNIMAIALQNEVTGIINNCSGQGTKVIDLVNDFLAAQGASIVLNRGFYPYPDFEPFAFWGDNTKLTAAKQAYAQARQIHK